MSKAFALVALVAFLPVASSQCTGVWSSAFDSWCETNCGASPSFCPSSFCTCATPGAAPATMSMTEYEDVNCCDNPVEMYYIENSQVHYMVVDQNDHSVITESRTCASFLGPSDIEIDSNGNVIVADPVAGAVYVLSGDCTDVSVITSWTFDGIIDQPTALAIGDDGLYVSGSTRVFFLTLNSDYQVETHTRLDFTALHVDSMDFAPDGTLFLVQQGGYLGRWDGSQFSTFFSVHSFNIPDIEGIRVTDCGLYMSITDSNQIWRCSDYNDPDSCEMFCPDADTDSHTCSNMGNPYGLTVDCDCNVYSAQAHASNIVFNNDEESAVILSLQYHPRDVEIMVNQDCSAPSPTRTRTPTPTSTASPSTTSSPSVSASPTPTPTPTSSSSPSPSPTSPPSPSPTPSEQYEQFLIITDYNTVCSAGSCDGVDLTMLGQLPASTRSYAVEHTLKYYLVLNLTENGGFYSPTLHTECDIDYDPVDFPNGDCSRAVDPFDYIDFDASLWETYIDVNDFVDANSFPPIITPLAPYAVGEYPNPLEIPALNAVHNCVGHNDVTFRIVIQNPRPIASDFRFGTVQMLRRDTNSPSNSQFVNIDGNNPDPLDAYKEFTCIESV